MIVQFYEILIAFLVVGLVFMPYQQYIVNIHHKEKNQMRKRLEQILVATFAIMLISTASASATNAHQDHRGACARSTTSISKGLSDLKYNGVLGKFAKQFGIKSIDGSLTQQLKNQLTVGTVASATNTNNSGCDGQGHTFGAGKRTLYKGEHVIVRVPAKYGKDVCNGSHAGCKQITITVTFLLPGSCWNGNTGKVKVKIFVKKIKVQKPKPCGCKSPGQTQTASNHCSIPGNPVDGSGNCVVQQNQQQVQGAGNCNSTNSGNQSGTGEAQGSCNQVNVTCNGMGSCSPSTTNVCTSNTSGGSGTTSGTGGNASSETCNSTTPPPTPPPTPPTPPTSSASCTGLDVQQDLQVARGVIATVTYQASGTSLTNIRYDWGNGQTSNTTQASGFKYVYSTGGTYNVYATLTFKDSNQNVTNVTCAATTVTPKDGTTGAGSTTGGTAGGTGSGGTAGTGSGTTCRDANGNIVPGPHDQFGYCV